MNILVPVSLAKNAKNTLSYAVALSKEIGAKLYVIHVYKPFKHSGGKNMNQHIAGANKDELKAITSQFANEDVEIVAKPVKGDVVPSIKRIAKQLKVDLIIMGAKTASRRDDVFLGRATGRVTKKTKTPVIIVPPNTTFKIIKHAVFLIKQGELKTKGQLRAALNFLDVFKAGYDVVQVKTPTIEKIGEVDVKLGEGAKNIIKEEHAFAYNSLETKTDFEMLFVIRRKKGFFTRLWSDNKVLKTDFNSTMPIYVIPS